MAMGGKRGQGCSLCHCPSLQGDPIEKEMGLCPVGSFLKRGQRGSSVPNSAGILQQPYQECQGWSVLVLPAEPLGLLYYPGRLLSPQLKEQSAESLAKMAFLHQVHWSL
ncbi:collagenase 3 [Platysternon megacephalum]|uniref:Collagenase 3 n=1 Tax=Platysternon megacephalum TaxID=55544 RepID=A0A4D9ERU9_9SAUR|nr:collagenase 3 [Platysternon megacephalum]